MDWGSAGQFAAHILIDYFAVIVGVVGGALFAVNRKLDIVGTISLGLVVGYGGGVIRDLLLHDQGIFFMQHPTLIIVSICLAAAISLFRKYLASIEERFFYVDALSMALYALAGSSKTWAAGAGFVFTVVLGGLTAVGGGALRDIAVGKTPAVFEASNFYAVSGISGAIVYVVLSMLGAPGPIPDMACVAVAFLLTVLSRHFNWRTHAGA